MKKFAVMLIALALCVAGCNSAPGGAAPTADVGAVATQVAANIFATETAAAPKVTGTPQPTNTPQATDTPEASPTPKVTASFGSITFAAGVLNDETPIDARDTFPEGVTIIYALFDGQGLKDGQTWRSEWVLDGTAQPKIGGDRQWDAKAAGPRGVWWISVYNDQGIYAGEWQLNLYIDDQLRQSNTFTVEAYSLKEPSFGPITFASDVSSDDKPVDPVAASDPTFPAGLSTVYAFFDGISVPSGTEWTSQWFYNDAPSTSPKSHTWDFGPNEGNWISFQNTDDAPLEAGVYELQLTIGKKVVNLGTFVIPAE